MGIRMIATKDMTYATRRLKAGDEIENVSGPNARLLTALGRATVHTEAPADELADLRALYTEKFDKRPYHGWDAAELRSKIDEVE
jgi:hypothetical protein